MQYIKLALICLALGIGNNAVSGQTENSSVAAHLEQTNNQSAPVKRGNVFLPTIPTFSNSESKKDDNAEIDVKKVEFKLGASSNTVEKLAKQENCISNVGAGLLTTNGPVEVYRISCLDGKTYMARCELRQCNKMLKY